MCGRIPSVHKEVAQTYLWKGGRMMLEKLKDTCICKLVIAVSTAIIALVLLCSWIGSCRKYDYAVMFSENAVVTLQQIKAEKWEIVNARWAADRRGVWNYEFIVRKPAPFFGIGKKKQAAQPAPAPAPQQPAPAQPAPAPEQPAPAPAK